MFLRPKNFNKILECLSPGEFHKSRCNRGWQIIVALIDIDINIDINIYILLHFFGLIQAELWTIKSMLVSIFLVELIIKFLRVAMAQWKK